MIEKHRTCKLQRCRIVNALPLVALLLMSFVSARFLPEGPKKGGAKQHYLDTLISGRRLIIKDITHYDPSFIKGLKSGLGYETIKVIDDSLYYTYRPNTRPGTLVTYKYTIPTNLELNEVTSFTAVNDNKPFALVLKRTNYTNLVYQLKQEDKTIKSGVAILQSTFYFGAEGQDDENGNSIYLRQYIDPNQCGAIVKIEIEQAKIATISWCTDDKSSKWMNLPIFRR